MGRNSTGSLTVDEAAVLKIKDLRGALLRRGRTVSAVVTLAKVGSMNMQADWTTEAEPYLQLQYIGPDGTEQEYRIEIEARRSNLGAGHVLYFRCPDTGRRCRMLYMAYNYPRFKAREAYRIRLYYSSQLTGGRSRYNDQYWKAERDLQDLRSRRQYLTYKGQPTRLADRIQALQDRQDELDRLRWTAGLPAVIQRRIS